MDLIKRAVAAIFDFLQGIVVFLAILVMVYLFLFSPQEVSGRSMEPSFYNAQFLLTNKIVYKLRDPQRGEIVIFKSPANKDVDFIKRVIGMPGDTVKISGGKVFVNRKEITEPYLAPGTYTYGESFLSENVEYTVPDGTYFLFGDNRPHSSDSREFGPIGKADFIGMVMLRYFPFDQTAIIHKSTYPNL